VLGPFRIVVTGVRGFHDSARPRDLLDRLLSQRLPDVVILSRRGRGTEALATHYFPPTPGVISYPGLARGR
jgi:hypothetical protein